MDKYQTIAAEVLRHVGDRQNVKNAYHCMTRLRLNLKDAGKVDIDSIRAVDGVLGIQNDSGELQVIIGPKVEDVYNHFVEIAGLEAFEAISENLDPDLVSDKPMWKVIPSKILEAFSASMAPLIPLFVVVGVANVIAALIGPTMLNLVAEDAPIYSNFYNIGQSILYFLPIFTAYTASRYFKTSRLISLALAALLVYPDFIQALSVEGGYTVYGIPAANVDYGAQLIPALLIVWIQSYVERGLKKVVPEAIDVLLVPFGTMAIMLPLGFCILGPLGYYVGEILALGLSWLYRTAGPVETMVVTAVMPFLTVFGVGKPIFFAALTVLMANGTEYSYMGQAMVLNNFLIMGVCLGYIVKVKDPKKRQYGITSLAANALGGVSEPTLFGIILPNPKTFAPIIIGGAVGGLAYGLMNVGYHQFGPSNVLGVIGFLGGNGMSDFFGGCIASALCFVVAFITMLVLYKDDSKSAA